jgi:RND family efflux transporter MFP subunit
MRLLALGLVPAAFLAACLGPSEAEREEAAMKAAVPVRLQPGGRIKLSDQDKAALGLVVKEVIVADLPRTVLRYGRVRARLGQEAFIVSPVAGRIARLPAVERGASVAAGAAIVEILPVLATADRVSLGAQRADIAGQIESTRRELLQRESDAARARDLAAAGIASTANLQTAETAVATTRARLEALKQARGIHVGGEGAPITLRAPVDGMVVSLDAELGAVTVAGDVLARILQPGAFWVDVSVPPEDPVGQGYEVAFGARRTPARLLSRGAVVESDGTRHDRLEVEPVKIPALMPGAIAGVYVARDVQKGVLVPEGAVVAAPDGDWIYVEVDPNTYEPRAVEVAARLGGQVRLASGIRAGERAVVQGAMSLRGESLRSELRHQE